MKTSLKKYRYLLLLVLTLSLSGLVSCSSDDSTTPDTLPPETQIGANTAGCYINNWLLVPKDGLPDWTGTPYGLTVGGGINFNAPIIGDDYFYVNIANYKDQPSYSIWIQINNMSDGEGLYTVGQANGMYFMDGPDHPFMIVRFCDGINLCKTYYSYENSGTIEITRFDYNNGIYSGTFSGSLYNKEDINDHIEVTDGRFDIKIAALNKK